jgi:hypothetical protein
MDRYERCAPGQTGCAAAPSAVLPVTGAPVLPPRRAGQGPPAVEPAPWAAPDRAERLMKFPLPYAFCAREPAAAGGRRRRLTLVVHGRRPHCALGEVLRKYPVAGQHHAAEALVQRISAAYSQGESSAALVASEVESDADLGA